jgi:hypothetical protein
MSHDCFTCLRLLTIDIYRFFKRNLVISYFLLPNLLWPRLCPCHRLSINDQQSVGKRSQHLMDTVNAKKRWTTIYWRVNKLLKESRIVTRLAKERALFLKIDIIDI